MVVAYVTRSPGTVHLTRRTSAARQRYPPEIDSVNYAQLTISEASELPSRIYHTGNHIYRLYSQNVRL
jgi:hypothetical protein